MLSVSNAALEQVGETVAAMGNSHDTESCLRMVRADNGLALAFEPAQAGDDTFEFKGRTVLAVPDDLADICNDKTLDVDDAGQLLLE